MEGDADEDDDKERFDTSYAIFRNPCKICPFLWIGDENSAKDHMLAVQPMDAIVSLGSEKQRPYATYSGITYHRIVINDWDTEGIIDHFEATYEFISKHMAEEKTVLVHCQAGVSR